jgi:hypothetical protein
MTTNTSALSSPGRLAAPAPLITITPSGCEALKLYEQEITTYLRELPRLLVEGHTGRHALIKGDQLLSIWDTQGDAIQAGRERFGLVPIFVKTIDPRDPERFALLNTQKDTIGPS